MNKTVECLNKAFEEDPNAIHALMCNKVPCNVDLADDEFIIVSANRVHYHDDKNYFQVGALGLLNGVLEANGLPRVTAKFSDTPSLDGRHKLEGFIEYNEEDYL